MRRLLNAAKKPGWAGLVVFILLSSVAQPNPQLSYASDQSVFTGLVDEPVGIAGGFRNGPKLRVTSPSCNDPNRDVFEVDSSGQPMLLATIANGRPAKGCFLDSIAVFSLQFGRLTTEGGWPPNASIAALGKNLYLILASCTPSTPCPIDGFSPFASIPVFDQILDPDGSKCDSPNAAVNVDRWALKSVGLGGDVFWSCFDGTDFEVWRVKFSSPGTPTPLIRLQNQQISGRLGIAHPNFGQFGGHLLLYREDTRQLLAVNGSGQVAGTINVEAMPNRAGRGIVEVLPSFVYAFSDTGGGLFATVPARDEILQFLAATFNFPGDVLIITENGLTVRVFFDFTTSTFMSVLLHRGVGGGRVIQDAEPSPMAQAVLSIDQGTVGNPNLGPQGHIVGYLVSGTNPGGTTFDPVAKCKPTKDATKEVCQLRFGRTGNEDSIVRIDDPGKDVNFDGIRDLKFFADPDIALCGFGNALFCIMTGDIPGPGDRFEAD